MSLRIQQLITTEASVFDDFYAIYARAFPKSEQKNILVLQANILDPSYTVFLAYLHEKLVGFCIFFHLKDEDFFLLEYLAVDEKHRGKGIGSELLKHGLAQLFKEYGNRFLLIEIDSIKEPLEESILCQKREQFYRSIGALRLEPLDYLSPPLSLDEVSSPPMKLLVHAPNSQKSISKKQLRRWLEIIYMHVYSCSKEDKRIDTMLHHAPNFFHLI